MTDETRMLDSCASRLYTLENENERLREEIKYLREQVERAIMEADSSDFKYARRGASWQNGFTCAKIAAAANVRSLLNH